MYAIGESTHTLTYIRKEGNNLEEQGPKGRNPQKVDNVYTLSTRVSPTFILSTCMGKLGDQHNNTQGNTRKAYKARNEDVKAITYEINYKGNSSLHQQREALVASKYLARLSEESAPSSK